MLKKKEEKFILKDTDYLTYYVEYSGILVQPSLRDFIDIIIIEIYNNSALLSGMIFMVVGSMLHSMIMFTGKSITIVVTLSHLILCAFVYVLTELILCVI